MSAAEATITKSEVMRRVSHFPKAKRPAAVCLLVGHSKIVTACFGYIYCARCGDQIADKLAGTYSDAETCVQVAHNCELCRKNYKAMDWRDKYLAPDPFALASSPAGESK